MKGIWIVKDDVGIYKTSLREQDAIAFIPVEHSYEPRLLGRIYYLDSKMDFYEPIETDALIQHVFHPLGEDVYNAHPDLTKRGLAQRIELITAEDLLNDFPDEIPIINDATKPEHLKYCERLGITPREPIPLWEYVELLQ